MYLILVFHLSRHLVVLIKGISGKNNKCISNLKYSLCLETVFFLLKGAYMGRGSIKLGLICELVIIKGFFIFLKQLQLGQ